MIPDAWHSSLKYLMISDVYKVYEGIVTHKSYVSLLLCF